MKGVVYVYEMKRRKGNGYVTQTYELNRLDYIILDTLYDGNYKDFYHAITIAEMMDENDGALAVVVLSVLFVLALSPGPRKMSSAAARFQPFAGPKSPDCLL